MNGFWAANFPAVSEPPPLIVVSLFAGLLIGPLIDRVIVQLPAAMKRAWLEDVAARPGERNEGSTFDGIFAAREDLKGASLVQPLDAGLDPKSPACAEPASTQATRPARLITRRAFVASVSGVAFALLAAHLGPGAHFYAALAATTVLIAVAFIDWDHHLLPDLLVLPLLGSGLLVNWAGLFVPPSQAILGAIVGYGSLWLLARAYQVVFGSRGIGEGDLKLLGALGAWLGWKALLPITQLAAGLALAAILASMLGRPSLRVRRQLPYGTYLAIAGWLQLIGHPL